ncbi:MAG: hypothetical protein JWR63_1873 [Conexibacter sp.]|nr:hypothetical protein [Conexibacter sp.]
MIDQTYSAPRLPDVIVIGRASGVWLVRGQDGRVRGLSDNEARWYRIPDADEELATARLLSEDATS